MLIGASSPTAAPFPVELVSSKSWEEEEALWQFRSSEVVCAVLEGQEEAEGCLLVSASRTTIAKGWSCSSQPSGGGGVSVPAAGRIGLGSVEGVGARAAEGGRLGDGRQDAAGVRDGDLGATPGVVRSITERAFSRQRAEEIRCRTHWTA